MEQDALAAAVHDLIEPYVQDTERKLEQAAGELVRMSKNLTESEARSMALSDKLLNKPPAVPGAAEAALQQALRQKADAARKECDAALAEAAAMKEAQALAVQEAQEAKEALNAWIARLGVVSSTPGAEAQAVTRVEQLMKHAERQVTTLCSEKKALQSEKEALQRQIESMQAVMVQAARAQKIFKQAAVHFQLIDSEQETVNLDALERRVNELCSRPPPTTTASTSRSEPHDVL